MSKPKRKPPIPRAATVALAKCAVFALSAFRSNHSMVMDLKTKETQRWQDQFFDALDMVGISYDRDAYFAKPKKNRRRS